MHELGCNRETSSRKVLAWSRRSRLQSRHGIPRVSIVVPDFGLTIVILRILKGNPKKELQWRVSIGSGLLSATFLWLKGFGFIYEGLWFIGLGFCF